MLHYIKYEHPTSKEWVTFVHGAGGSSSIWFKQLRDFKKEFNVLLLDLRGHGKSKLPLYAKLKKYTFPAVGNDIVEVLDHLEIEKTHLIGISLGTIIIREIAEKNPNRVQSMILGGAIMKLNIRARILMKLGVWFKSIIPYLLLYKFFAFIIMPKKTHQESRSLFVREAKKLYQNEFIRWFTLASQVNPLLSLFRIKDSGIPTLYLMGEEDHMFLPSISKLVQKHKMSILDVVPNCGHVVNVEQPAYFNQRTISFLKTGL